MEGWSLFISIIGTGITTAALVYAIKTNCDRKRVESLVKAKLASTAGSVELIRKNPHWADKHFKAISELAQNVSQENIRKDLTKRAQAGARDVAAAERMLRILRNDILSQQKGMFGTQEIDKYDQPNESPTYHFEIEQIASADPGKAPDPQS